MDKLTKFQDIVKLLNDTVSKEEFEKVSLTLIDFIKRTDVALTAKISDTLETKLGEATNKLSDLEKEYQDVLKRIDEDNKSTLSNIKKWVLTEVGKRIADSELKDKLGEVDDKLAEMNEMTLPDPATIALEASKLASLSVQKLIPTQINLSDELPLRGAHIKAGLENIDEEEDKLTINAISNLREELDSLKKEIEKNGIIHALGTQGGGRIVKVLDLSSQLNGVLKVFSVQAMWRVISIQSSSFPNAFRPTVDYVYSASAHTITFTSEIDASTTLASGQTITVIFSE